MDKKQIFSKIGLGLALTIIIGQLLPGLVIVIIPGLAPFALEVTYLCLYGVAVPLMLLMWKNLPRVSIEKRSDFGIFRLMGASCLGLLGMYVVNIAYLLVMILFTGELNNIVADAMENMNLWSIALFMVIIAPIAEELIFRKLFYGLLAGYGKKVFIIASSIIFGLYHMNIGQAMYAFLIGLILAWIYSETGKIQYTIVAHMVINFIGSLLPLLISDNEVLTILFGVSVMVIMMAGIVFLVVTISRQRKSQVPLISNEVLEPIRVRDVFSNLGMIVYLSLCMIIMFIVQVMMLII